MIKLTNNVIKDKYTDIAYEMFDLQDEADNTEINTDIELPNEWQIGLIYGMSGAGKSTILKSISIHFPIILVKHFLRTPIELTYTESPILIPKFGVKWW